MRVISGTAKGRRLKEPVGFDIRPTSAMVKESIFNIVQFDVEGRRVLDLFAGTGQFGVEALSRGAENVVFVDSSREAVSLIRESGGISVLAHPISLYVAWGRLPDLIKALKEMGLSGLEAWHPIAKNGSCRRLETLAKSLGLYVTEGSDFHGAVSPDRKLGHSGKYRKISETVLDLIPELNDGVRNE